MPITVNYNPDARGTAPLAVQAGYGQYMERLAGRQQQERMQQTQIRAQQEMAQFQAQQEAQNRYNQTLWDANNRDVMANRDAGRQATLDQSRAGIARDQFGLESEFRAGETALQREHEVEQRAAEMRNQSPLRRQLADLDASEAEMRKLTGPGGTFEPEDFVAYQEKVNAQRKKLAESLFEPTDEEKIVKRDKELRLKVPGYDQLIKDKWTVTLDKDGVPKLTPPQQFDHTEAGLKQKGADALEAKRIAAGQAQATKAATDAQKLATAEAAKLQKVRDRYNTELAKAQALTDDYNEPIPVDMEKFNKDFRARQEAEEAFFNPPKPGQAASPTDAGIKPVLRSVLQAILPPEAIDWIKQQGGTPQAIEQATARNPVKVQTAADAGQLPPGTVFVDDKGVRRQVPKMQHSEDAAGIPLPLTTQEKEIRAQQAPPVQVTFPQAEVGGVGVGSGGGGGSWGGGMADPIESNKSRPPVPKLPLVDARGKRNPNGSMWDIWLKAPAGSKQKKDAEAWLRKRGVL